MAYRARFWKKVRRWLGRKIELQSREAPGKNVLASQLAELLKSRGSEVITMTTL